MKLRKVGNDKGKPAFTDLRQVMDYSRPLTIFFSGVEYEQYLDILYNLGVRNFLMSYQYLRGKGTFVLKKYPDVHIFIDSGAYTYQTDPKYEDYTPEQWENQIKEYLDWAEKRKDNIFAIADLDLQYLPKVGYEMVYGWRKKYFEPFMLRTGLPVCFIYHEDGLDVWERMCQRYPYVGFSLNTDNVDVGEIKERFRIAEKYNTLIQGMASTKTQLLCQFPFYTVDSTTWNVGLKYGEISVWNGSKMSRIKKTDFETKAFPAIELYDRKFDFDLIRQEDKEEMIRVNAYAFVQAEKYINERLKSRMYWFKKRTTKIDVDNLPEDFFPDETWFSVTDPNDTSVKEYAEKMNINPDCDEVYNLVYDMTMFLNWDSEEFETRREEYFTEDNQIINELHDRFVNRIVPDVETKISDLQEFFRECLSGKNDTLLQIGTNFDRIAKERDNYIEEEAGEYVDIDEGEIRERVKNLVELPEEDNGEAEFEKLDKEIFKKAQIVPVFDEGGKFIKGQVYKRKPKKIYSAKYPKFACDTCMSAAKCPEYRAGYVCAYSKMFNRFETLDMGDIIEAMQSMVDYNISRTQKAMINEVLSGVIDGNVTSLINQNMQLLNNLQQMYENGNPEVLRHTSVVRADGTREETTSVTNPQSGGILEKLFSGMGKDKEETQPENEVQVEESTVTMNTELTDGDTEKKDEG